MVMNGGYKKTVPRPHHESILEHIEHTIAHHVVGIIFLVAWSVLFFLSSSVSVRQIAYGASGRSDYTVSNRPLSALLLHNGWARDEAVVDGSCLSLPEKITTKRNGFPFYYQEKVAFEPCGVPQSAFNTVAFFLNCLSVLAIACAAAAVVHAKHKHDSKKKNRVSGQ